MASVALKPETRCGAMDFSCHSTIFQGVALWRKNNELTINHNNA